MLNRSISRCQTNLSTVTTPCSLNTTQYKQNSLLLQPTTENEELLFDEIVSNYEKLLKSKDVKPSVSPPADTSHINMNLNPNYDFALNRDISECIMTPRGW